LTGAGTALVAGKVEAHMSDPDRPPQPLIVTLAALTVVSGFLDAISFLGLGHVFIANMTGNVVLIGFAAAGAPGFSFVASLCALGLFLAGAVMGGRLAQQLRSRRSLMLLVMTVEAACTAVAAVVAGTVTTIDTGWPRFTVIALLAFGVGQRNAAVRRLKVPDMSTTVLTTTLTGLASDSSLAGGANPNASHRVTSVVSQFGGALVGALLVLHVGAAWSLGAAAGIVVCTAVYFSREAPVELDLA
jgi:uncharacterized membrane protein YoaK (UPF0700 family)